MDITIRYAAKDYESLPHWGESVTNNHPHRTESGQPPRYFAGYNVSILTKQVGNTDEDLRKQGLLCVFCHGIIRKPKQTPCGDRTCTNCCARWIYLNQDASGTAPCPVGHMNEEGTDIEKFCFEDCSDDIHYKRQQSKKIFIFRCPLPTKDGSPCPWLSATLHNFYQHEKIAHCDIENGQNLWEYYQHTDRKVLDGHEPSVTIDSLQGFGNLASEEETQLLKPVQSKFVSYENQSSKSPLDKGHQTLSSQTSWEKQNNLTPATIKEASKKLAIENEKKFNTCHPVLSPSINRSGAVGCPGTDNQSRSSIDQVALFNQAALSSLDSVPLLSDRQISHSGTDLSSSSAHNDPVLSLNSAEQLSLSSLEAYPTDEPRYFGTNNPTRSSNDPVLSLNSSEQLSLSSLEAYPTDEPRYFGTNNPTRSSNDPAPYHHNKKGTSPESAVQPTDDERVTQQLINEKKEIIKKHLLECNIFHKDEVDAYISRIINDMTIKKMTIEEINVITFMQHLQYSELPMKSHFATSALPKKPAPLPRSADNPRINHPTRYSTDQDPHCIDQMLLPVMPHERDGSLDRKKMILTNFLLKECNLNKNDIAMWIASLESEIIIDNNKTLDELDFQSFNQYFEEKKMVWKNIICSSSYNQAAPIQCQQIGTQAQQSDRYDFSENATARIEVPKMSRTQLHYRGKEVAPDLLSKELKTDKKSLLRDCFKGASGNGINIIYDTLRSECEVLLASEVETLTNYEFYEFLTERLAVRGTFDKGKVHSWWCKDGIIPDAEIRLIMEGYDLTHELLLKNLTSYPETNRNTCLYRFGAYGYHPRDEQHKATNHKLNQLIFEQQAVNTQEHVMGYGLYTANNLETALNYRLQDYNIRKSVAMFEIVPQHGLSLVTLEQIPPEISKSIKENKCHRNNFLYVGGVNSTVVLIKDATQIKSLKVYHPNMRTKVIVPFTREQIEEYGLRRKEVSETYIGKLNRAAVHKTALVCSPYPKDNKVGTVFKFEAPLRQDLADRRGITITPPSEIKYYFLDGSKYIRVKIEPPLNDGYIFKDNHSYTSQIFHIQYYYPERFQTT